MSLKWKAFIYRLSDVFGLHIYLAGREEWEYLKTLDFSCELDHSIEIGMWQARNGFTTVWTYRLPFHKAFVKKLKHAFEGLNEKC